MNTIIIMIVLSARNILMLIILLWLKKLRQIPMHLNFKLLVVSGLESIKIFLAKVTPKFIDV